MDANISVYKTVDELDFPNYFFMTILAPYNLSNSFKLGFNIPLLITNGNIDDIEGIVAIFCRTFDY